MYLRNADQQGRLLEVSLVNILKLYNISKGQFEVKDLPFVYDFTSNLHFQSLQQCGSQCHEVC